MQTAVDTRLSIRHDLRPGDLGRVTELHGEVYATEFGFDHGFEAYVAETLAEFGKQYHPERNRLWLAEDGDEFVGSIAILGREQGTAQLRWFLVHPAARGRGLGRRLLDEALAFCRAAGYRSVDLWTVDACTDAARLYLAVGFRKTEATPPAAMWGATLSEERYDLTLA